MTIWDDLIPAFGIMAVASDIAASDQGEKQVGFNPDAGYWVNHTSFREVLRSKCPYQGAVRVGSVLENLHPVDAGTVRNRPTVRIVQVRTLSFEKDCPRVVLLVACKQWGTPLSDRACGTLRDCYHVADGGK